MQVTLAYGRAGLRIDLPDDAVIVRPAEAPGLPDEAAAIREALRRPLGTPHLRELVRPEHRLTIVFSDLTRPMPNDRVLPILLEELPSVPPHQVTLLNALGTHRPQTTAELEAMLGPEIVRTYPILQHDPHDRASLVQVGRSSFGHPILLHRAYVEADVRILTGFVEPHFFAGFSGGAKSLLPGIAGMETTGANHGASMIAHPRATWGVTAGNPIYEEIEQAALLAPPTFCLNVALNRKRAITDVWAGDWKAVHAAGRRAVAARAFVPVERPFEIVITTNAGYPLDLNLYQAVKGMSAASRITRPGGTIVLAAECSDGIPDHGKYKELLWSTGSPEAFLETIARPGFFCQDRWEAQIQAQVQRRAIVYLYSDRLDDETIRRAWLQPCRDIPSLVEQLRAAYGKDARIAVLPEGPQTVPTLFPC
ncbi:MAG: nickel-dependent lactate racemase [Chloroflexia bacterium]